MFLERFKSQDYFKTANLFIIKNVRKRKEPFNFHIGQMSEKIAGLFV
jgi:hypothetical protein